MSEQLKWWEFSQINSGGVFSANEKLCHRLFIEAESVESACDKAISLGVYFNGCDDGIDCSCCGDRWHEPFGHVEFPVDLCRGQTFNDIRSYAQYLANEYGRTNPDCRIYFANGVVEDVFCVKPGRLNFCER